MTPNTSSTNQSISTTTLPFRTEFNDGHSLSCYTEIQLLYTDTTQIHLLLLGTLYGVGSLLAVTFNGLFLAAMRRNRTLHKLSNYLLVCLSVFDLSSGLKFSSFLN